MADVFISHVEEDSDIAVSLAKELQRVGYTTWYYEEHSLPGKPYLLQVAEALAQCRVVVLVVSPKALSSQQVTNEIVTAYESGKPFIPVLRNITHVELQKRQPMWRQALGASTSIPIRNDDLDSLVSHLREGLRVLGIEEKAPLVESPTPNVRHEKAFEAKKSTQRQARGRLLGTLITGLILLIGVGIIAFFQLPSRESTTIDDGTNDVAASPVEHERQSTVDTDVHTPESADRVPPPPISRRAPESVTRDPVIPQSLISMFSEAIEMLDVGNAQQTLEKICAIDSVRAVPFFSQLDSIRQKVRNFSTGGEPISALTLDAHGRIVIGGGETGSVYVWDAETSDLVKKLTGHQGCINSIALDTGNGQLYTGSDDRSVIVWSLRTGRQMRKVTSEKLLYDDIVVSSCGGYMITSGTQSGLVVWQIDGFAPIHVYPQITVSTDFVALDSNVEHALIVHNDTLSVLRLRDGAVAWSYYRDDDSVTSVTPNPITPAYTVGYASGVSIVYSADNGGMLQTYDSDVPPVRGVAASRDGGFFAIASGNNRVSVWNTSTGDQRKVLAGINGDIRTVAANVDGSLIIASDSHGGVTLWSLR